MIQFNETYEYVGHRYVKNDTAKLSPKLEKRLVAMGIAREPDPEPEIVIEPSKTILGAQNYATEEDGADAG